MGKIENDRFAWLNEQAALLGAGTLAHVDVPGLTDMLHEEISRQIDTIRRAYYDICLSFLATGAVDEGSLDDARRLLLSSPSLGRLIAAFGAEYGEAWRTAVGSDLRAQGDDFRPDLERLQRLLFGPSGALMAADEASG